MSSRTRNSSAECFLDLRCKNAKRYKALQHFSPNWFETTVEDWNPCEMQATYNTITKQISDTIGQRNKFNTCLSNQWCPVKISMQLPSCIATLDVNNTYSPNPFFYGSDLGILYGTLYLRSFLESSTLPTIQGNDVNWSDLVDGVGQDLDGKMKASSNLLVDLIQIGQTFRMMKNPFGLLDRLPKGNLSFSQVQKAFSNRWLEYRYGWRNLYFDIVAIATIWKKARKHVEALAASRGVWHRYSRRGNTDGSYSTPYQTLGTSPYSGFTISIDKRRAVRKACFGADYMREQAYEIGSTLDYALQGLGTNDILGGLWDLLPYSFVVDWIFNVQSLISSRPVFWNSSKLRRMGYSLKTEYRFNLNIESIAQDFKGGFSSSSLVIPDILGAKSYSRLEGFPPGFDTVGLFGGLSITHIADTATLIAQRL